MYENSQMHGNMTVDNSTHESKPEWFAIHVRSRFEFKVAQSLSNFGIASFHASVERLRQWKDRKKLVSFPLFPGYVFVNIDRNSESRLLVLKTPGVVRFVEMLPGIPESIPEKQIT